MKQLWVCSLSIDPVHEANRFCFEILHISHCASVIISSKVCQFILQRSLWNVLTVEVCLSIIEF